MASNGLLLMRSQNRVPLSMAVNFVSKPPLAVADHHHAPERRIFALGIELLHRGRQGRPQPTRRVANGVPRVVEKEPDMELLPDARIPLELVHQLGPARGARGRPVHQHHGDLAGPVRLQHEQAVLGAVARELVRERAAAQQGGNLHRVERALIELEARAAVGSDSRGWACPSTVTVEAWSAAYTSRRPRTCPLARRARASSRRSRAVTATFVRGPMRSAPRTFADACARRQARRQRRAEPGPAVAVPEAPDLDGRRRDEVVEPVATPRQPGLVQGDLERPEREWARPGSSRTSAAALARCGGSATAVTTSLRGSVSPWATAWL